MGTFKEIMIWIFIFVVGSLIVSFLIYPESFSSFKENVKDITNVEDNLGQTQSLNELEDTQITECLAKFNECKRISETKIGISIKINEYKKFTEYEGALEFYKTWSDSFVQRQFLSDENMPFILIATSTDFSDGYQKLTLPYVVVCDSNYNFVGQTKTFFSC